MLSISLPLAWVPSDLLQGAKDEAALWQQELDYTRRTAISKAQELMGQDASAIPAISRNLPPLNVQFASRLLEAPLEALQSSIEDEESLVPGFDRERYERDYAALERQELPYWL